MKKFGPALMKNIQLFGNFLKGEEVKNGPSAGVQFLPRT